MKCAICNENDGTIPLKRMTDGSELVVCEACAHKHGYSIQLPIPVLTDFLFGGGKAVATEPEGPSCPTCHMHRSDLQKSTLLGCPRCYEAFAAETENMIESMQCGRVHVGRVPLKRSAGQVEYWRARMREAVEADDFELATRIRDAIAGAESKDAGGGSPAEPGEPQISKNAKGAP